MDITRVPAEAISDVTITHPTSDMVPVYEDPRRYRDQIIVCNVEWQRENSKALTLVKFVDPSLVTAGFTALNSTGVENMSRARIVRAARSPLCRGRGTGDLDPFVLLLRRVMLQ